MVGGNQAGRSSRGGSRRPVTPAMDLTARLGAGWLVGAIPLLLLPEGATPFSTPKRNAFVLVAVWWAALAATGGLAGIRRAVAAWGASAAAVPALVLGVLLAGRAVAAGGFGSAAELLEALAGPAVGLALLASRDAGLARRLTVVHGMALSLVAVLALAQFAGWRGGTGTREFSGGAPVSTLGNPLFLGTATSAAVLMLLASWLGSNGRAARLASFALFAVTAALAASQARGAWLGTVVGVAGLFVHPAWRTAARAPSGRRKLSVAAATVTILGLAWSTHGPWNPAGASLAGHAAGAARADQWRGRLLLWESTAGMVRRSPLLGWGPRAVGRHLTEFQGRLLATPRYGNLPYRSTAHSHSDWLQAAAELGIVGLGLVVWTGVASLAPAARRSSPDPYRHVAACAVLAWTVDAWINGPLHLAPSAQLVWVWLGLAAGGSSAGPSPTPLSRRPARGRVIVAVIVASLLGRPFARDLAADQYQGRGMVLAGSTEPLLAIEPLLNAVALQREDRRAYFHAGTAWFRAGKVSEAVRSFRADVLENPGVHSGWHNLGLALSAAGDREDARESFRRAALLNPGDPETRARIAEHAPRLTGRPLSARRPMVKSR